MGHADIQALLESHGADKGHMGNIIVPEHVPKIKDFYSMDEGVSHPLPSLEFMAWRDEADRAADYDASSLIPGLG